LRDLDALAIVPHDAAVFPASRRFFRLIGGFVDQRR